MPPSESKSVIVLELAEEFLARYRNGERPPISEYIQRHPDLEAEIREVFPAMAMMENIALSSSSGTGRSASSLPSGKLPFMQLGDYRLIREVGRGGMGVVYEAEQVSLGRHVALKVLPPQARDAKQRLRFEREARAAAKLHHTNIVPVFGVGEHEGQPYYVMQYIQGLGLDEVLRELQRLSGDKTKSTQVAERNNAAAFAVSLVTGAFPDAPAEPLALTITSPNNSRTGEESTSGEPSCTSKLSKSSAGLSLSSASAVLPGQSMDGPDRKTTYWQSVAQIGVQTADSLEYAHKQGVVHRDIKPSNLLLDKHGTVWVTDFGLAKAEGQQDLTHTGDVLGTLRYMPPEAFDGRADARGDVYSLGLTLYELIALRRAFDEKDRQRLVKQVTTQDPTRLDTVAPTAPRDLATIVHKAIDKDPKRRYQTAGEFADDLRRFIEDRPIRARRIGPIERAWRWSHRNPLVAGLTAAVVVLLVAGTIVSTVLGINATLARNRADASAREAVEYALRATEERNRAIAEKNRADREAEAARANMYAVRLHSIQMALENSNINLAQDLLTQLQSKGVSKPAMGWEWRYHDRICHSELRRLSGHTDDLSGLAVNPDGSRLISCADDQTVREWDTASGLQLRSFTLKDMKWPYMALSADGTRIAIGSGEGVVKILDAANWQELHHFQAHSNDINAMAFSADGTKLATASDDDTVKTWSVADGKQLQTFSGHTNDVRDVAFSPDGKWLASASLDCTARIWNAKTGEAVHTLRTHTAGVLCVAYDPGGRHLATGSRDWTVRIWESDNGRELSTLTGHTAEIRAIAYSPDGTLLASAGHDRAVKLWEVTTGRERTTYFGHRSGLYKLVFSPDGRWLASGGSDKSIRMWSVAREHGSRMDRLHSDQVRAVEFSPDGRWLASVGLDGKIFVRDVITGQGKDLNAEAATGGILGMAYSPDSRWIATAGDAGIVTTWDTNTGKPLYRVKAHTSWSSSLAVSGDGRILASGSHDKSIKLLDAATGQELKTFTGHKDEIRGLVFSADGLRLFSGCNDHTIRIWDVETGKELQVWKGHSDGVTGIALTPDNKRLVSCSSDRTAKIWDVDTGKVAHTLTGHNHTVWCVRFFANGTRVVTAGWDQTIRVWDASTGLELASLKGHADPRVLGVAVSPDGGRIASAGGKDLAVHVWDGRPMTDDTQLETEAQIRCRCIPLQHTHDSTAAPHAGDRVGRTVRRQ
jgi:WD40 repeat protein/serine/threonine protein kinase